MTIKRLFEINFDDLRQLRFMGALPPVTLAIAVAATVAAGYAGQQVIRQHAAAETELALQQVPADARQLEVVAAQLATLAPALTVRVQGADLVIEGKEGAYLEWNYALASVPAQDGKLIWSTRRLCVNECASNVAYQAQLSATYQEIRGAAPGR